MASQAKKRKLVKKPAKSDKKLLTILPPYATMVVEGKKTGELRSEDCKYRGQFFVAESGSGKVIGAATLSDTKQMVKANLKDSFAQHQVGDDFLKDYCAKHEEVWMWVLTNPVKFKEPVPYTHNQGAVKFMWLFVPDAAKCVAALEAVRA